MDLKRWAGIVLAILIVFTLPALFFLLLFTASMTEGFLWSGPSYESYKAGVWARAICISVLTVPYVLVLVFGATEERRRNKRIAAIVGGAAVVLVSCSLAAYWSNAFYVSNVKYTWHEETLQLQEAFFELGDDLTLLAKETNHSFGGGYPNKWSELSGDDDDSTSKDLPYKRIVFVKLRDGIMESDYERIDALLPDVAYDYVIAIQLPGESGAATRLYTADGTYRNCYDFIYDDYRLCRGDQNEPFDLVYEKLRHRYNWLEPYYDPNQPEAGIVVLPAHTLPGSSAPTYNFYLREWDRYNFESDVDQIHLSLRWPEEKYGPIQLAFYDSLEIGVGEAKPRIVLRAAGIEGGQLDASYESCEVDFCRGMSKLRFMRDE